MSDAASAAETSRMPRGVVIVVAAWLLALALWFLPGMTRPDGIGYFEYLPSAIHDLDLSFYDEWRKVGLLDTATGVIAHEQPTATGLLGNHWPVGAAVWCLPAYLAGDLASAMVGAPVNEGFATGAQLLVLVANALAGLLALLVSWKLATTAAGERCATVGALGVFIGSPLLFYALRTGLTSHAIGAFASAVVVLCAMRLRDSIDSESVFAFGLAAGFAFAVRPQNAPLALLPLVLLPVALLRSSARRAPLAALGGLVGALPQLVASTFVNGTPWGFLAPGVDDSRAFAAFERIWIWEPLLSWYHGMLPWTPVLGLALAGLVLLIRVDRRLALAGLLCFASQWAINATLERSFWGGLAFGQRRFDNCTAFFVLGLAVFARRLPRWIAAGLVALCCAWTMALVLAAPRLDLNAYQPPSALVDAALAALADVATWLAPLGSVAGERRVQVAGWMLLGLGLAALAAWTLRRRSSRAVTAVATAWLLGASALLLVAGVRSGREAAAWATIAERNRDGAFDFRLGLLKQERRWLEMTGREEEAARTGAEIEAIERRHPPR